MREQRVICNRCGALIGRDSEFTTYRSSEDDIDLCLDCFQAFKRWVADFGPVKVLDDMPVPPLID